MGRKTMYETIMTLPLFQGVGADQVSEFLEKTSIAFLRFSEGERIVSEGEEVKKLKFLLSGKIRVRHKVLNGEIEIISEFEGHEALAPTRLFGMHPRYDFTLEAVGSVSVMEFSKKKYISLLQSDTIYLMNFANILSLNVQRTSQLLPVFVRLDLSRAFAEWIVLFTSKKSELIQINGLSALRCLYGEENVDHMLERMKKTGLVDIKGEVIEIVDREGMIEYACTPE